jgi:hypothetical protein
MRKVLFYMISPNIREAKPLFSNFRPEASHNQDLNTLSSGAAKQYRCKSNYISWYCCPSSKYGVSSLQSVSFAGRNAIHEVSVRKECCLTVPDSLWEKPLFQISPIVQSGAAKGEDGESGFFRRVAKHLLVFWGLFCFFLLPGNLQGASLEMGRAGEVLRHEIETPNILTTGTEKLPWKPSTDQTLPFPKIEPGAVPPIISAIPELMARFRDLIGTRSAFVASAAPGIIPLAEMLGTPEALVHTGVGSTEKIAVRDGTASVEVFLPTYNPATIEVRVINPDNTEEIFSGDSLLTWIRPNDTARAPVRFKGVEQADSMYQNKEGDWSPNPKKYEFDVKAGQRVIFSISGRPLETSFIRVTSSAF